MTVSTDPSRFNGYLDVAQIDVGEDDPSDPVDPNDVDDPQLARR